VPKPKPSHQFSLFDFNTMRPRLKVPISAARILEAKALMAQGKPKESAAAMREVREGLERFEARLTNKLKEQHGLQKK